MSHGAAPARRARQARIQGPAMMTGADLQALLAARDMRAADLAKAFEVHQATIYRLIALDSKPLPMLWRYGLAGWMTGIPPL